MAFWQSQGLLREDSPDCFVLVEEMKGRSGQDLVLVEEDEVESAMASVQDQREEELQVILRAMYMKIVLMYIAPEPLEYFSTGSPRNSWSYIVGILAELKCCHA